ncbi:MAG: type IX secretion system sortase PorU [Ichthyobacteriaceae bacterium]|nr:type IX secretion system sortase PorU [Ichthyobacteriaceae bacterium]
MIRLFLLLLFTSSSIIGQEIIVDWEFNNQNISLGSKGQFYSEGKLYAKVASNAVKGVAEIVNVEYLILDTLSYSDTIKIQHIPDFKFHWGQSRKQHILNVNFNPLVMRNGKKQLVKSFTVVVKDEEDSGSLSKKTGSGFATNSVLATGKWVKLAISKSGVFKIDYNLMSSIAPLLGTTVDDLNPKNIAVFGQVGGMLPEKNSKYIQDDLREIPIRVDGEDDLKFNTSDKVLFYAEGAGKFTYDIEKTEYSHINNIYTDDTYVFVTLKNNGGKRIVTSIPETGAVKYTINTYDDVRVHEVDKINVMKSGQTWYGENFETEGNLNTSFVFNNRITSKPISVKSRIAYKDDKGKKLGIKINESTIYTYEIQKKVSYNYKTQTNKSNYTGTAKTLNLKLTFNGESGDLGYLDFLLLSAKSNLNATGNQFIFRSSVYVNKNEIKEYKISNQQNVADVWSVVNPLKPVVMPLKRNGDFATFKKKHIGIEEFVMLSGNDYYVPLLIGGVANQNLHSLQPVEYLIITSKEFMLNAEKLANFHRKKMTVTVVDVKDIYNEFSAGRQDLVAIRQFVRMIYHKGDCSDPLKYLLMFGDASYDFKNRVDNNTNYVPSYQSYSAELTKGSTKVTDDFFALMDNDEGDNVIGSDMIDIAVGRIPIRKTTDADNVVNKIIAYNTKATYGNWKNKIQFVVDDATHDWEIDMFKYVERLSTKMDNRVGVYNHQKIYLDNYKIQTVAGIKAYPQAHAELMNNLQGGNLVTSFTGHGSRYVWTANKLFYSLRNVPELKNINKLPMFITITCEFSRFDRPDVAYCGGEQLISSNKGGAIGLISTTREIGASTGMKINSKVFDYLFPLENKNRIPIGEVLRLTKNDLYSIPSRRTIFLIGDPALMLAYPDDEIILTSVNNGLAKTDTIKALMDVNIKGEIRKLGSLVNEFNGELDVVIYDDKENKESLDNNNLGSKLPYWEQEKIIYQGKASVVNGKFDFNFTAPEGISYKVGDGKISMYASSELSDASGFNINLKVGDVVAKYDLDKKGPEVMVYVDDKLLPNGGLVKSSSMLKINFADESGINTMSIKSEQELNVSVKKEGDENKTVLNTNYEAEINDSKKGTAVYEFLDLNSGKYQLEVSVSDVYNNISTKKIKFEVDDNAKQVVDEVSNYPNPFTNSTMFKFSNGTINNINLVEINIYTISGRLVKTIIEEGDFNENEIKWNGETDNGTKLDAGTYFYKISVKNIDGNIFESGVGKLMILN